MTMHVNLSPEMEGFIKAKVAGGSYGNATEVIRDAIRRLQDEDTRISAWKAAIAKGDAELDRGEGAAYSPQLMDSLADQATRSMHSGAAVDPDVLP